MLYTKNTNAKVVLNPAPPQQPVRLVFIHHSCGQNWLADENGGLGLALRDNNYIVSDTNYGWGTNGIGDHTDIGQWWLWFRSPDSAEHLSSLYQEHGQHCRYSRLADASEGDNEIVMFKSCYPNSNLRGNVNDVVPPISSNPLRGHSGDFDPAQHSVANAKGIYSDLLDYFKTRQDKLFIAITAPPVLDLAFAQNARSFNTWLMKEWLQDYPFNNVAVFDFYNIMTSNGGNADSNDLGSNGGSHHRLWEDDLQHTIDLQAGLNPDILKYPTNLTNDHPTKAGNLKATGEFIPLLNIYYNNWKAAIPQ